MKELKMDLYALKEDIQENQRQENICCNESESKLIEENKDAEPVAQHLNETKIFAISLRIWKNVIVLSVGFFSLITAYETLGNLQSTMNAERGIGTLAQAAVYASFNVSCFLLATTMIKRLGCKMTIVLCMIGYCPYIAANYHPTWFVFIPSAVLCGVSAGPLWAARGTYLNRMSFKMATCRNISVNGTSALFFGVFCAFYQIAQICGNLISYFLLQPQDPLSLEEKGANNYTCAASFCSTWTLSNITNSNLKPPDNQKRYLLVSVFLAFNIAAALIIWAFLDPVHDIKSSINKDNKSVSSTLVFAAFRQLMRPHQILLFPITLYVGLENGFYISDFTKAYIACSWGLHRIGFVTICYSSVCGLSSLFSGPFVNLFGRIPLFVSSAAIQVAVFIYLLVWIPNPENYLVYFLVVSAWGFSDGVWWSQIPALYGITFQDNEEAAFSNFYFWNSLGFSFAYAYNNALCTYVKIYILFVFLGVGIAGYLVVDGPLLKNRKGYESREKIRATCDK